MDNSLIYANGSFYRIMEVNDDKTFLCKNLTVEDVICPQSGINLSDTLLFRVTGESNECNVNKGDIKGKCVLANNVISFLPYNVLME